MDWTTAENGEMIKKDSVIGVGPVKAVKVTSGTKDNQVTRTIYNYTLRIGPNTVIKSPDFETEQEAVTERWGVFN